MNEYPKIFVASNSNEYLPNEYICLCILKYSNIFQNLQSKHLKKVKNEGLIIFVALKPNKYIDE